MKLTPRYFLLALIIFFSVLSGIPGILPLGEIRFEAYSIPLVFFLSYELLIKNLKFKKRPLGLSLFLLSIILFSFVLNYDIISINFFKSKSGFSKFFGQFILIIIFLLYYNILCRIFEHDWIKLINFLKRFTIYGFYVLVIYALFEYIALFSSTIDSVVNGIDSAIRDERYVVYAGRLRGLQYESPAFGAYLGYVFIVFLDQIFIEKKKLHIINIFIVLFLSVNSGSRTGLIITFVIGFFYLLFAFRARLLNLKLVLLLPVIIAPIFIFESIIEDKINSVTNWSSHGGQHSASNFIRVGSQLAAFSIAIDHPYVGIGLGQFGFKVKDYYPFWLEGNHLKEMYSSEKYPSSWPPAYSLLARLSAEFGLIVVLLLVIWIVRKAWQLFCRVREEPRKIFVLTLLFYFVLFFLQFDSIRNIHFWNLLVLLTIINNEKKTPIN